MATDGAPPLRIDNLVLGTAGHIDHGKSSIVRRLTGLDPDRLPEEKKRKLTIDLGFAPWQLPDGRTVGIIDVPGHERFIKNMVAGATGVDVVLLVVAADDGVMPQTREHLEILSLLGIRRGLVAITKIDLVDPELAEVVALEVSELLVGTFLEDAPLLPISSETGEGFDALVEALVAAFSETEHRPVEGPFRMPVQRVFTARGFGTILTGVPVSGQVRPGQTLELLPHELRGKIRGIQAYKSSVELARAGHSTALNIPDFDHRAVERGAVLAEPGLFQAGDLIEARLRYLSRHRKPLENRTRVRFHSGTAEVLGELVLLDTPRLEPGADALCQLRLDEPVVVVPGDRYVLRLHSPLILLGGGAVLGLSRHRLKAGKDFVIERLRRKEESLGDLAGRLVLALDDDPFTAMREDELARLVNREPAEAAPVLEQLCEDGRVCLVPAKGKARRYVTRDAVEALQGRLRSILRDFHDAHPKRIGLSRRELFNRSPGDDAMDDLALTKDPRIASDDLERIHLVDHAVSLEEGERAFVESLLHRYRETALESPDRDAALTSIKPAPGTAEALFDWLLDSGQLLKLDDHVILHPAVVTEAGERVQALIREQGPVTVGVAREALGTSRKYLVPLFELLDERGVTQRDGNVRVLPSD